MGSGRETGKGQSDNDSDGNSRHDAHGDSFPYGEASAAKAAKGTKTDDYARIQQE